jgi:hypothetical protein
MTATALKHFDTLEYVKQARKLGTSQRVARMQKI